MKTIKHTETSLYPYKNLPSFSNTIPIANRKRKICGVECPLLFVMKKDMS